MTLLIHLFGMWAVCSRGTAERERPLPAEISSGNKKSVNLQRGKDPEALNPNTNSLASRRARKMPKSFGVSVSLEFPVKLPMIRFPATCSGRGRHALKSWGAFTKAVGRLESVADRRSKPIKSRVRALVRDTEATEARSSSDQIRSISLSPAPSTLPIRPQSCVSICPIFSQLQNIH